MIRGHSEAHLLPRPRVHGHTAHVDLALSYRLPWRLAGVAFSAFANVSNLLDRSYDEVLGFPARPINALAGLRARF